MKRSHALLLTLLIFLVLVVNSADFLFRQAYYEVWDFAANSLSVIRAKHFAQLYGPYSRWQFQHPGPVLFYVQALGEWLFYDTLHWVKSPFPGQTLPHVAVMCCFFVATLMIFANWMPAGRPRWWFLCGALALAIPHFTAVGRMPSYDVLLGPSAFLSVWSAHALLLPFLCLLTAGASVAAGRGEDLPILALASGYLLQLHVAEPMFVLPVFALGYVALGWHGWRQENLGAPAGVGRRARALGAAWRNWPRSHVLTVLILGFFSLPFLVDFCKGRESNFAAILTHLRSNHDPHKSFERAWFYFLQFGAYTPYTTVGNDFAAYDRAGMLAYLRAHAPILAGWAVVALLAAWALVSGLLARGRDEIPVGPADGAPRPGPLAARRFRGWAAVFLCGVLALTLRWNVTQEGLMFYFNSWFTFSIYYFALLIALAVGCALLRDSALATAMATKPLPDARERLAGVLAVVAVAAVWSGALRLRDPSPGATRAMHAEILRLEKDSRATVGIEGAEPTRMLLFGYDTAPVAIAVVLQLARDGVPFAADDQWQFFLGRGHRWGDVPEETMRAGRVQRWLVGHGNFMAGPAPGETDQHITEVPYLTNYLQQGDDVIVRTFARAVDPAAEGGASIRFQRDGNQWGFIIHGWSNAEKWGAWSNDSPAMLEFRPVPVADESGAVQIELLGLVPLLDPAHGLTRQRLRVFFGGKPLGSEATLTAPAESLTFSVPASEWNRSSGRLEFEYPDATSPHALDPTHANADTRLLGVGMREVRFRFVPPPVAAPSASSTR